MRDFKFFKGNVDNFLLINELIMARPQVSYENVEFCFQFGEDEPVPFMAGSEFCRITLDNTPEGYMEFTDNGNTFKLFARERP